MDCGSLLPLFRGSLLPYSSPWTAKPSRYRVGGAFTLRRASIGLFASRLA